MNYDLDKNRKIKYPIPVKQIIVLFSVFLLVLATVGCSSDKSGNQDLWEVNSNRTLKSWDKLISNEIGEKLDISAVDKDIKITVEGVIADDLNTIALIKIEDLKGDLKYVIYTGDGDDLSLVENTPIKITGNIINVFEQEKIAEGELPPITPSYSNLYTEEKNISKVMVRTGAIEANEGTIEISIDKLSTLAYQDKESAIDIEGAWNLQIPIKKDEVKSYSLNETIEFDGNEVVIQEITIAPTQTNINYKVKRINEEKGYIIENMIFSIKHGNNKYGSPAFPLGFINGVRNQEYLIINQPLESLYSENPENVKLVVESYDYLVEDIKVYDVDVNNLPQTIEYNSSNIIIEDIEYDENLPKVTVKEDESNSRKYNSSFMEISSEDNSELISYSEVTEYDFRDKDGKIATAGGGYGNIFFVKEQKIGLMAGFKETESSDASQKIVPEKLHIKGQSYTGYPNKEITIELKD